MTPFVRHYISHQNLRSLLKMGPYSLPDLDKVRGNLDKGVRNLNAYVRDALGSSTGAGDSARLLIPPVHDPHAPTPVTLERLEQRKKGKGPLTDLEIEDAIGDLLDYFEVTFATLKESLTPDGASLSLPSRSLLPPPPRTTTDSPPPRHPAAWRLVSMRLWKDILTQIEGLLVPPLSERPTEMRPLSEKEVDVVYKWLGVRPFPLLDLVEQCTDRSSRARSSSSTSFTAAARASRSRTCATRSISVRPSSPPPLARARR